VFSTISSENTNQQYWDLFHLWEKKKAGGIRAADAAFNNGQGYGP
jgi:hypothetical protein